MRTELKASYRTVQYEYVYRRYTSNQKLYQNLVINGDILPWF